MCLREEMALGLCAISLRGSVPMLALMPLNSQLLVVGRLSGCCSRGIQYDLGRHMMLAVFVEAAGDGVCERGVGDRQGPGFQEGERPWAMKLSATLWMTSPV